MENLVMVHRYCHQQIHHLLKELERTSQPYQAKDSHSNAKEVSKDQTQSRHGRPVSRRKIGEVRVQERAPVARKSERGQGRTDS